MAGLDQEKNCEMSLVGVDSKSASYMESNEPPLREHSFFSKLHLNLASQCNHFNI
jgi:hypothetical protein